MKVNFSNNMKPEENMEPKDFEEWLQINPLNPQQTQLINDNIALFQLVFNGGLSIGKKEEDKNLFKNIGSFHDAVCEFTDKRLTDNELIRLFYMLPKYLQDDARHWGLSDTEVRDSIYVYIQDEGFPQGFLTED
jgi:hypothetical protein